LFLQFKIFFNLFLYPFFSLLNNYNCQYSLRSVSCFWSHHFEFIRPPSIDIFPSSERTSTSIVEEVEEVMSGIAPVEEVEEVMSGIAPVEDVEGVISVTAVIMRSEDRKIST
jgi:hypothetical protein